MRGAMERNLELWGSWPAAPPVRPVNSISKGTYTPSWQVQRQRTGSKRSWWPQKKQRWQQARQWLMAASTVALPCTGVAARILRHECMRDLPTWTCHARQAVLEEQKAPAFGGGAKALCLLGREQELPVVCAWAPTQLPGDKVVGAEQWILGSAATTNQAACGP